MHSGSTLGPMTDFPYACPIDSLELEKIHQGYRCANNHSFDISRHGYVNLLPVQFKPSKDPGDSSAMVTARRNVMNAGIFEPLSNTLVDDIIMHLPTQADQTLTLVDAGCGEGYYTHQLHDRLLANPASPSCRVLGVDISKWAITAAAKQYPEISWAVANNKRLPVVPGYPDVITSLFGFETWLPWSRLQCSRQSVVVVNAGPRHLIELREIIYDSVNIHSAPNDKQPQDTGYKKTGEYPVTYTSMMTDTQTMKDILQMTPHAYKAKPEKLKQINRFDSLDLTIDIVIRRYTKQ